MTRGGADAGGHAGTGVTAVVAKAKGTIEHRVALIVVRVADDVDVVVGGIPAWHVDVRCLNVVHVGGVGHRDRGTGAEHVAERLGGVGAVQGPRIADPARARRRSRPRQSAPVRPGEESGAGLRRGKAEIDREIGVRIRIAVRDGLATRREVH